MPNFDEISQSTAEIKLLPVSENGRPPDFNSISGFDFNLCTVIGIPFAVPRFDLVAGSRKKVRTGQDRTVKQKSYISPLWGEAPTAPIETKICTMGHLADIITYAKFQDDIFRCYDFTVGRISHFPIDFCMGLTTVQRYCAVCDE